MPNPLGQRESAAIPEMNANLIWKKEPRYDTFLYPAAPAPAIVPFFQVPHGIPGSGFLAAKTASETNMSAPGSLGDPNQFLLYGFTVEVKPAVPIGAGYVASTAASDWALLYHAAIFRFITDNNNIQLEIPLTKIPTGIGFQGFAATSIGATPLPMVVMTNGVPSAKHYFNFTVPGSTLPLLIRGSQTFRCEIGYPLGAITLLTATRVRCFIHGVYGSET